MEELARLEQERGNPEYLVDTARGPADHRASEKNSHAIKGRTASREMCTFLILNISSLQLIPVNMIAYRSQYGSTRPAAIIAPSILATLVSTVVAIVFCKVKGKLHGGT